MYDNAYEDREKLDAILKHAHRKKAYNSFTETRLLRIFDSLVAEGVSAYKATLSIAEVFLVGTLDEGARRKEATGTN